MRCPFQQFPGADVFVSGRLMRVDPNRRINRILRFSNSDYFTEITAFCTDRLHQSNTGFAGPRNHRGQIIKLRIIQMAVRIDKH